MAKRFTDTDKWQKFWISQLSPNYKLFWVYLLDMVDNAGIYDVNLGLAQYLLNVELEESHILKAFGKHIVVVKKNKWFIPKFIEFQYGDLNPANKAHLSAINKLKKYNLDTFFDQNPSGSNSSKSEVKIKRVSNTQNKRKPKDLDEVKEYLREKDIKDVDAFKFWSFYETNGWVQGKNKPIKNWKMCVNTWRSGEQSERKSDGTITYSCPDGCQHIVAKKNTKMNCKVCDKEMVFIGDIV